MAIILLVKQQQPRIRGHYNSIRTRSADPKSNSSFSRFRVVIVLLSSVGKSPRDETKRRTGATKYIRIKNMKLKAVHMRRPDSFDSARRQTGAAKGSQRGAKGPQTILTGDQNQTQTGADCSSIVRWKIVNIFASALVRTTSGNREQRAKFSDRIL